MFLHFSLSLFLSFYLSLSIYLSLVNLSLLASVGKSLKSTFETSKSNKVPTGKIIRPAISSNSSVPDILVRLNSSNCVNNPLYERTEQISKHNCYKSNLAIGNQCDGFYPKINASKVAMTSTNIQPPNTSSTENILIKSEIAANEYNCMENTSSQNDERKMPNIITKNFNVINSFVSSVAIPNLDSSTNCNYITTPKSGQQQHQQQKQPQPQQQQPPTLYSSTSNSTQIQMIDSQNSQHKQQSQQTFNTKVTRHNRSFFHSICCSTNHDSINVEPRVTSSSGVKLLHGLYQSFFLNNRRKNNIIVRAPTSFTQERIAALTAFTYTSFSLSTKIDLIVSIGMMNG